MFRAFVLHLTTWLLTGILVGCASERSDTDENDTTSTSDFDSEGTSSGIGDTGTVSDTTPDTTAVGETDPGYVESRAKSHRVASHHRFRTARCGHIDTHQRGDFAGGL